jgi:predicted dehydrogenase
MVNKNSSKPIRKVLFVGLGSVGQRHLQNFKEVTSMDTVVLAYRTSNMNCVIKNGRALPCESLAGYYDLIEYKDFDKALEQNPDLGFVCNPSNLHLETAIKLAKNGSHLFIEKPLATDTKDLSILENLIKKNKLITMVGFQTRFHPAVGEVKLIVDSKRYGEVVSAEFFWHTYLPEHHSYEDYRRGYAARNDLGGGVVFGLSHELDLIQWLFGVPLEVYALEGARSKLEMDVEDTVSALFKCDSGKGAYPVSLNISYAQGLEQRKFSLLMQDAMIECDLQSGSVRVIKHNKEGVFRKEYGSVKRNDLFRSEMENFLTAVVEKKETDIPVSEGKKSLIMTLAIHESLNTGRVVKINYE